MSQIRSVVDCIKGLGQGTANEVHALCPQMTRPQVLQALNSAAWQGYLERVGTQPIRAFGKGAPIAIYVATGKPMEDVRRKPLEEEMPRGDYGIGRVSSVWELGAVDNSRRAA